MISLSTSKKLEELKYSQPLIDVINIETNETIGKTINLGELIKGCGDRLISIKRNIDGTWEVLSEEKNVCPTCPLSKTVIKTIAQEIDEAVALMWLRLKENN